MEGDGEPLVVTDALCDWVSPRGWTVAELRRRFGANAVTANDRAPARRGDAADGRPQHSVSVMLADYLDYYEACNSAAAAADGAADHGDAGGQAPPPPPPPFYLNGWRAASAHPVRTTALHGPRAAAALPYSVTHARALLPQMW